MSIEYGMPVPYAVVGSISDSQYGNGMHVSLEHCLTVYHNRR